MEWYERCLGLEFDYDAFELSRKMELLFEIINMCYHLKDEFTKLTFGTRKIYTENLFLIVVICYLTKRWLYLIKHFNLFD